MKEYLFVLGSETNEDEAYLIKAESVQEARIKFKDAISKVEIQNGGEALSLEDIENDWVCLRLSHFYNNL